MAYLQRAYRAEQGVGDKMGYQSKVWVAVSCVMDRGLQRVGKGLGSLYKDGILDGESPVSSRDTL